MKYTVYATMENGQGHCEEIGSIDDITDFQIRIGMFADDVVITVEEDFSSEEED